MKIMKDKYLYHESVEKNLKKVSGSIQIDLELTEDINDYKKAIVYGIVKDKDSNVIKNALVNILSEDKKSLMHTYTNEKGEYSFFSAIASGNYNIFAISKEKTLIKEECFNVDESMDMKIDLVLKENKELNYGIIEGSIRTFITKREIPNACIKLSKQNDDNSVELFAITSTNKQGEYVFFNVPKGSYILNVHAFEYISMESYTSISNPNQIVSMQLSMQCKNKDFYRN